MRYLGEHRTPGFTRFALGVMNAGADLRVLGACALVALVLAVAFRAWRPALGGVVAVVAASVIASALKDVIQRPRPAGALTLVDPGGYAMPSGHAARAAALSVAVLVGLRLAPGVARRLAVGVLVVLNLVLGVLLVYLGTHWPTDVLAGWALGALVGWLAPLLMLRLLALDSPGPDSPGPAEPEAGGLHPAGVGRDVRGEDGPYAAGAPRHDGRRGAHDAGPGYEAPPAGG